MPEDHDTTPATGSDHGVEDLLAAAGPDWPTTAHRHGWEIRGRNDEHLRDQVRVDGVTYYWVEVSGAWHRQGWSSARAAQLRRSYRLSYFADIGAQWLSDHPAPTGTDQEPAETHYLR